MNTTLFEFALLCFTSLFTMVNPLGVMPIYLSMTTELTAKESMRIAVKASIIAAIILTVFALTGRFIFTFFDISVHSLRIVGGVIFFSIGYEMLQARLSRSKQADESRDEYADDITITPLAIPMISGPGAITTVIIFMNDGPTAVHKSLLFLCIILVTGITCLCLIGAKRITTILGNNGNKVLMRIMGLIVMVIAVEFFFGGLKPVIQDILTTTPQ